MSEFISLCLYEQLNSIHIPTNIDGFSFYNMDIPYFQKCEAPIW